MLWQKLLGTSAVATPIQYIGSVRKNSSDESGWDSSGEALNVLSIADLGDLVVIAFTFDESPDPIFLWGGMAFTAINDQTGSNSPGAYVGYRFVQSGDANPYVTSVESGGWQGLSIVASVFRNATGYVAGMSGSGSSGDPNPPLLTATGTLGVITGHLKDDVVTDWGAPSGYTIASYEDESGTNQSSTVIAYRIGLFTSQDPAAFTGSGSDEWRATTIAFN